MIINQMRAATVLVLVMGTLASAGLVTHHPAALSTQTSDAATAQAKKNTAEEQTIRDLIRQLGDNAFEAREAAEKRLAAIGEPALELLRLAATDNADPEVRERAGQLVRVIGTTLFREVRRFNGHIGAVAGRLWVTRVAVTPDGKQVVSAGAGALRCWELASGKEILVFGDPKAGHCWGLGISSDGRRVIAGDDGKVARVFDLKTGKQVQELVGHTGPVWGAALLADGKRAVTGSWDQSLRVWDVGSGQEIRAFAGVRGNVRCLAVSPDEKSVATGHFDQPDGPGTVRLWDIEKGQEIRSFEGHTLPVNSVAFSPDGKTLLSASFDKTVRLWDVASGKELRSFKGHAGGVETAAFTPDGRRVVSCGDYKNPSLRLWDVASGKQIFESAEVPQGFLGLAVLPDGRHCISTGKDSVVRVWHWAR